MFSYERVDNAAMDVGAGRVDVLFIISDPAKKHAEKEGLEIALITTETVAGGQSVAVAEGEAALRDELNKVIAALKEGRHHSETHGQIRPVLEHTRAPHA